MTRVAVPDDYLDDYLKVARQSAWRRPRRTHDRERHGTTSLFAALDTAHYGIMPVVADRPVRRLQG